MSQAVDVLQRYRVFQHRDTLTQMHITAWTAWLLYASPAHSWQRQKRRFEFLETSLPLCEWDSVLPADAGDLTHENLRFGKQGFLSEICATLPSSSYTGWPKKLVPFLYALTSPNFNQFSKLLHCQNQEKICNNTISKRSHHTLSVSLRYLVKCQVYVAAFHWSHHWSVTSLAWVRRTAARRTH